MFHFFLILFSYWLTPQQERLENIPRSAEAAWPLFKTCNTGSRTELKSANATLYNAT
jgi:hypothetical protein